MRKGGRQSETTINGVTRGSVSFIKILLVAQGIHPNPGPRALPGRDEDASPAEPSPTDQSPTNNHHTDRNKVANNQNQQAQEKGKKIKQIHAHMINDLTRYLRPGDNDNLRDFIALLEGHLGLLNNNDIKHVNDIFNRLEAKGIISYGKYDAIYEDFRRIHVDLEKILQRGAEDIIRQVEECGQSGHMTGGPGHRTIQGIGSIATDDQRKIREIEDKGVCEYIHLFE
ncbi:uncharacterized protein [Argopecten irradians]|uniref:uncharacterized protein n=1 Tax=Argopecten irradians TaxID=31199 RepID=UPI0037170C74